MRACFIFVLTCTRIISDDDQLWLLRREGRYGFGVITKDGRMEIKDELIIVCTCGSADDDSGVYSAGE